MDYGTDRSISVNVDTGDVVEDPLTVFAAGDARAGRNPAVTDVAYSNNSLGATTSTLYGVEGGGDAALVTVDAATGTLRTVGLLGILSSSGVGFDISGVTGTAYFATSNNTPPPPANRFYALDVQTGQATLIGTFGNVGGGVILDVAAAAAEPVPEGNTSGLTGIGCGFAFAWTCRRNSLRSSTKC